MDSADVVNRLRQLAVDKTMSILSKGHYELIVCAIPDATLRDFTNELARCTEVPGWNRGKGFDGVKEPMNDGPHSDVEGLAPEEGRYSLSQMVFDINGEKRGATIAQLSAKHFEMFNSPPMSLASCNSQVIVMPDLILNNQESKSLRILLNGI